jgi:hypothetical protein
MISLRGLLSFKKPLLQKKALVFRVTGINVIFLSLRGHFNLKKAFTLMSKSLKISCDF